MRVAPEFTKLTQSSDWVNYFSRNEHRHYHLVVALNRHRVQKSNFQLTSIRGVQQCPSTKPHHTAHLLDETHGALTLLAFYNSPSTLGTWLRTKTRKKRTVSE